MLPLGSITSCNAVETKLTQVACREAAFGDRQQTLRKSPTAESLDFGTRMTAVDFRVNPMTAIGNIRDRPLLVENGFPFD